MDFVMSKPEPKSEPKSEPSWPQGWKIKSQRKETETEHWRLYPKAIDAAYFHKLMTEVVPYCRDRSGSRQSCLFGDFNYAGVPCYSWDSVPAVLLNLVTDVQKITGHHYDYILVHLYVDGNSYIGWHNDKEAEHSPIASLSLGATRKFRLRGMPKRNELPATGYDYEYCLQSGDLFVMKPGCQTVWEHTVPKEQTVHDPRINVTFRVRDRDL